MEESMLKLLQESEGSWWYRGRARVASVLLHRFSPRAERAIDYGAGFGGMCSLLTRFCNQVYAFEPDSEARRIASTRGYAGVFDSAESALSQKYSLAAMFDVIEHIEHDKDFLERLRNSLHEGGKVVITVPAYQWLWSSHDTGNMHFRRYTKGSLCSLLRGAGYTVEYAGYWNMLLFIPAALVRLTGKSGGGALNPGDLLNTVLYGVVLFESLLLRYVSLPFGLSVVAVATKQ